MGLKLNSRRNGESEQVQGTVVRLAILRCIQLQSHRQKLKAAKKGAMLTRFIARCAMLDRERGGHARRFGKPSATNIMLSFRSMTILSDGDSLVRPCAPVDIMVFLRKLIAALWCHLFLRN